MELLRKKIIKYSKKYDTIYKGTHDELIEKKLKKWFLRNKYLDRTRFIELGLWKSKRQKKNYESKENNNSAVKEISKFALSTKIERVRIESLIILRGASWPVASVILHFAFPNKYSILDFRATWSLKKLFNWNPPSKNYNFHFWQSYYKKIREISKELKLSIRTIDK